MMLSCFDLIADPSTKSTTSWPKLGTFLLIVQSVSDHKAKDAEGQHWDSHEDAQGDPAGFVCDCLAL